MPSFHLFILSRIPSSFIFYICMIFAPSSCGFQFPSVRPYLKYADISNVCFLSSLSLTSLPQAWSKMFRDGHVSNVRLASLIADTLHGNEIPFNVPAFPCISHINCIYSDDFLTSSLLSSSFLSKFHVHFRLPIPTQELLEDELNIRTVCERGTETGETWAWTMFSALCVF
jgi:hypothetical protein